MVMKVKHSLNKAVGVCEFASWRFLLTGQTPVTKLSGNTWFWSGRSRSTGSGASPDLLPTYFSVSRIISQADALKSRPLHRSEIELVISV